MEILGWVRAWVSRRPPPRALRACPAGEGIRAGVVYTGDVTIPERIADLTRDLPPEKQAEVLDFVEFLRARRSPPAPVRRGSLEALREALQAAPSAGDGEPEWSPFDIEPTELGDVELDR